MPPFQLPERTATLVFEDGDLAGLELEVRLSVPFDVLFKIQKLYEQSISEPGLDGLQELMRYFAEHTLVAWNLSDANGPVPCTPEAFTGTVSAQLGGAMFRRYLEAVGEVPVPLGRQSRNGSTSKARRASSSRAR